MLWLYTLLIAILGGLLGIRLKIPAGAIVGSMFAVAFYSIFTGNATMPENISFITQVGTGAFIGSKINRSDFLKIKALRKPVIIMLVTMMSCAILTAFLIHRWTHIDLVTSMFSCAPGGILDMSLIADELGGNASITALFQTVRVAVVVSIFPSLILIIHRRSNVNLATVNETHVIDTPALTKKTKPISYVLFTMVLAGLVGLVGRVSQIPAGAMVFSMVVIALLNSFTPYGHMPLNLRKSIQFLGGAMIGSKITMTSLLYLISSWELLIILFVGLIMMNGISALLLHKLCHWDLITALFASAPGGVTDMAIIASDMGADTVSVAFMQLIRLTAIIGLYPVIISLILN